jgi:hypothetical protein
VVRKQWCYTLVTCIGRAPASGGMVQRMFRRWRATAVAPEAGAAMTYRRLALRSASRNAIMP